MMNWQGLSVVGQRWVRNANEQLERWRIVELVVVLELSIVSRYLVMRQDKELPR
jgi:hypothetical protein